MTRLLLLFLLLSATALGTHAAPVPKGGKPQLLIVSARTGTANIFVVNDDGTNEKNLTDSKSTNSYPAWSPDGSKIAFCSDRAGVIHVYVMDADGKNVKPITKGEQPCRVPTWSADGKSVAFCRAAAGNQSEICLVAAVGGEPKVLQVDGWDPAFSPDGKTIAFLSYRDRDGFRLYTMAADGTNPKNLHAKGNTYGYGYPTWSPDGAKIVWAHGGAEGLDLYTIDKDGKNLEQLTKLGGMTIYPTWSSNGKKIAFFSQSAGQKGSIQVMDADGKNAKVLAKDEMLIEGGRPAWKP